MNLRTLFCAFLTLFVSVFCTGCICITKVMDKSGERTVDTFSPSAVYRQSTNHSNFALEGSKYSYHKTPSVHAFLIVPDFLLYAAKLQTNENLSLDEFKELAIRKSENFPGRDLESRKRLPPGYEKVADLPTNNIQIEVKEHHPGAAWALLLPAAFVVDVVGFPFEAYYAFSHPEHW